MPVTVTEIVGSREQTTGESATTDLRYTAYGSDDDAEILAAVAAEAPAAYGDLVQKSIALEPAGNGVWHATVKYDARERREEGYEQASFDTTGGTQHITQALETVGEFPAPDRIQPDVRGAIGSDGQEVRGVDITVPVFNYQVTKIVANAELTNEYVAAIANLTGQVNVADFRMFAAETVLFLGASGTTRDAETWELTFKFAFQPNVTGQTIGDITGINKKGWEYLDVLYETVEDDDAKVTKRAPLCVYVHRVYERGDFSVLGLD